MRVFQSVSPKFGRGIQRVAAAIAKHAPEGVQIVDRYEDADLVVHHVIGVQNFHPTKPIDVLVSNPAYPGQRQAMVQYCLATTEQPFPLWWFQQVWSHCEVVWSYYDLAAAVNAVVHHIPDALDRFYEAPLGVDPIFHGHPSERARTPIYGICTSGYVPETEGVIEAVEAAARVGTRVLHLGPKSLNLGPHVSYAEGVSDAELAALYKSCRYVAGLRRVEGFELPAAEGLCSGAIPICFDQPHYRRWFEDAAEYVVESEPADLVDQLEEIFRQPALRLDLVDVALAQRKFSWPRVVGGFWQRLLKEAPHAEVQES